MSNKHKEMIAEIKKIVSDLGVDELSKSEFLNHSKFSENRIWDDGMTWSELCSIAGIGCKTIQPVTDEQYFNRLVLAVKELGRYPKTGERKKYGLNMSKRRYPTLKDFIKKAVELGYVENLFEDVSKVAGVRASTDSGILESIRKAVERDGDNSRPIPPIPMNTSRPKWQRTGVVGFPYAPQEEQGVLILFGVMCAKGIIPWQILDITSGKGIDATCYDEENNKEIEVELKHTLSRGSWNHPIEDLDYLVCWENRWSAFPKPVIELSKLLVMNPR